MDIIPSFLKADYGDRAKDFYDGEAFSNNLLRIGEVIQIIPPNDKESVSQKLIEYHVLVQHRENDTLVHTEYRNCIVGNLFGGKADLLSYTLRPIDINKAKNNDSKVTYGSRVLLLCINGNRHNAVIIGGLRYTDDKDDSDKGHHLHFVFNGIDIAIDKDGAMVLEQKGPTNADGSSAGGSSGTKITIQKTGNIELSTPNNQSIKIDQVANTIDIQANAAVNVKAAAINLEAPAIAMAASGGTSIGGGGPLKIGDGKSKMLLGGIYRDAESTMFRKVISGLSKTMTFLPMMMMGEAAAGIAEAVTGITEFEAHSGKYLGRNTSD